LDDKMRIGFRKDIYDNEGDVNESGIFISFAETTLIKFKDMKELEDAIKSLQSCVRELKEQEG